MIGYLQVVIKLLSSVWPDQDMRDLQDHNFVFIPTPVKRITHAIYTLLFD